MNLVKKLTVIFVIVAIAAGLFYFPFRDLFEQLEEYVKRLGSVGPIAMALAYVVTTPLFVPESALTIGVGTLFG